MEYAEFRKYWTCQRFQNFYPEDISPTTTSQQDSICNKWKIYTNVKTWWSTNKETVIESDLVIDKRIILPVDFFLKLPWALKRWAESPTLMRLIILSPLRMTKVGRGQFDGVILPFHKDLRKEQEENNTPLVFTGQQRLEKYFCLCISMAAQHKVVMGFRLSLPGLLV